MMNCNEVKEKLSEYLDGMIPLNDVELFKEHLSICQHCRKELEDFQKTVLILKGLDKIEPPPWFKQKILTQIRREEEVKKQIFRKLFYPLHLKIPIEAFATILIAIVAIYILKIIEPEVKQIGPHSSAPVAIAPEKRVDIKKEVNFAKKDSSATYLKGKKNNINEKETKSLKKEINEKGRVKKPEIYTMEPPMSKPIASVIEKESEDFHLNRREYLSSPKDEKEPKENEKVLTTQISPPSSTFTASVRPLDASRVFIEKSKQTQKEYEVLPRARVAIIGFENKSAKGPSNIENIVAETFANVLLSTNQFIILERQSIQDTLKEQNIEILDQIKKEKELSIDKTNEAELLITGMITEFESETFDTAGTPRGLTILPGRRLTVESKRGDVKTSHISMIIKVIDAKTGRVIISEQVKGKASEIVDIKGSRPGAHAYFFNTYANTPVEKAIKEASEEAVRIIITKIPNEYFRITDSH